MRAWVICRIIWISPQGMTKQLSRHWVQWNHRYCILNNSILSLGISESDSSPEEFTLRSSPFSLPSLTSTDILSLLDLQQSRLTLMPRRANTILSFFAKQSTRQKMSRSSFNFNRQRLRAIGRRYFISLCLSPSLSCDLPSCGSALLGSES
jgi:hypothetical protein